MVTAHNLFYADILPKEDGEQTSPFCGDATASNNFTKIMDSCAPVGSYSMNYYSDGSVGGPIGFEIDESGLSLWTPIEHARFLPTDEQCDYVRDVYPAVQLIVEMLVRCEDPESRLQCLAYEDDRVQVSQGLQGAFAVRAGLANAVALADASGKYADRERWKARLGRLDASVIGSYLHEVEGEALPWIGGAPGATGERGAAWSGEVIWPSRLVGAAGTTKEGQAEAFWASVDQPDALLNYATSTEYSGGA